MLNHDHTKKNKNTNSNTDNNNSKFLDSKSINTVLNSIFDLSSYNKKCQYEASGGELNAKIR